MGRIKKLFGGIDLKWKKLLVFAVIAGVYTGVMALLPFAEDTSLEDISISFEWWVLFGIVIILNSRTPLDAGLKCFVFFLVSQPIVYLVQVPFYAGGWSIFVYYRNWFLWTLLTFPMGFVGHWLIKKGKWWGLLILTPMLALVGYHYAGFLCQTIACFPRHLLSAAFCAATVLLYPAVTFEDRKIKRAGLLVAAAILIAATAVGMAGDHDYYNAVILASSEESDGTYFDASYAAALEDAKYGTVSIEYEPRLDGCVVSAKFKRPGKTELILTAPDGTQTVYELTIAKNTYRLEKKS